MRELPTHSATPPSRGGCTGDPVRAGASQSAAAVLVAMYGTSRELHPRRTLRSFWQRAMQFAHLVPHLDRLRDWYRPGPSPLHKMLGWRPTLLSVVRRPYINSGWGVPHRLAAIESHYQQVAARASSLWVEPWEVARLAALETPAGSVEIVLDSPPWFIHEGELSLNLFCEGQRIYTLVFSLATDEGEPVAYVGALQGLRSEDALDLYRGLTRAMHGLRPRDLLITAFQSVCRHLGLASCLAVGDARRVSSSAYFGKDSRVHGSYDSAWADHGGSPRPDGFFKLPVKVRRRTHAEIPSHKRSAYRKRYQMLDRLDADLVESLQARMRR